MRPADLTAYIASATSVSFRGWRLGPEGARALAAEPTLAGVTDLDLEGNHIGVDGLRALSESPHLGALTSLNLGENDLGAEAMTVLAASPLGASLEELVVDRNAIGADGAKALAAASWWSRVTDLDVSENPLGDEGMAAIVTGATGVTSLRATFCELGPDGVGAIADASFASLGSLFLTGNPLGRAGVERLAAGRHRPGQLGLDWCRLTARAAEVLVDSGLAESAGYLDLRGNALGEDLVDILAQSSRLGLVKLQETGVGPDDAQRLKDGSGASSVMVSIPPERGYTIVCPFCERPAAVDEPRCMSCKRDKARDAGMEEPKPVPAPSVPCPHCDGLRMPGSMACCQCGSYVPSDLDEVAWTREKFTASPSGGAGAQVASTASSPEPDADASAKKPWWKVW